MTNIAEDYMATTGKLFEYYYTVGKKALQQVSEEELHFRHHSEDNNLATIVKHMVGNMHSRFTDFLVEDGEKSWRDRDQEFVDTIKTKEEIIEAWESGWNIVFAALKETKQIDIQEKLVYIRNQGHTIIEAFSRQLAHYASHTGQIIYLAKSIKGKEWQSLSIPKGESKKYNTAKFGTKRTKGFFTDEFIDKE